MTRMTARQIAVQILFSMEANASTAEDAMALFFSEDHYASLKEEGGLEAQQNFQGNACDPSLCYL